MFLIYGAGRVGKAFVHMCMIKNIMDLCITDSSKEVVGRFIEGISVIEFDSIDLSKIALIVIATPEKYQKEISETIRQRTSEIEIVAYDEVIMVSDSDALYIGGINLSGSIKKGIYSYQGLISLFDPSSFNDLDSFMYRKRHRSIHKVVLYSEEYNRFFSRYRGRKIRVLEIGVNKGGSLQMWRDYFGENAEIFGLDINPECKEMEKEGFHICIGDQGNRDYLCKLKDDIRKLDIVIDDGGHMMQQQIASFEVLFDALVDDGVYLCEDTHTSYWEGYGGGYRKEGTFMEYAKWLLDELNEQYFDSKNIAFPYRGKIKSITFCDGMVFIEKKKYGNMSPIVKVGDKKNA